MPYVARDQFVRQLWTLEFVFVAETKLSHVFTSGTRKIAVPKVQHLDEEWARTELRRCGVAEESLEKALRAA